jgi:hypothetical protein
LRQIGAGDKVAKAIAKRALALARSRANGTARSSWRAAMTAHTAFALALYKANGSLDLSFGSGGMVATVVGSEGRL